MASLTPQFEIGKDVQYFLTPMTDTSGTWAAVGPTYPLQIRVEDVQIQNAFQKSQINPTHLFNSNPVIIEAGSTVTIEENRIAKTNVSSGNTGLGFGNVLEAALRQSYIQKLEVKRYDKTGTEIATNRITFMLQYDQLGTNNTRGGNKDSASFSTIAVVDSSTGAEFANPFFTSTSVPF